MKLRITKQGAPIINLDSIAILYENEKVILAEIDMFSKNCSIGYVVFGSDGKLGFEVIETQYSLHLDESKLGEPTEVLIEDYSSKAWDIFMIECSRYTIRIVL